MHHKIIAALLLSLSLCYAAPETPAQAKATTQENNSGFETHDSYIDVNEALKSRQYVRRAILSSVVKESSRFSFGRVYINHLLGYSFVNQRSPVFSKYAGGLIGLSLGYIFENGLALEGGAEFSILSDAYLGLRYVFRPEKLTLWPFVGMGVGREINVLNFADAPPEVQSVNVRKEMGYLTLGLLVPVVDVGLKAEARALFFGTSRLSLITGLGVILFF